MHNGFGANGEAGPLEPPIKFSVSIYLLCEFLKLDSSLTQGLESGFPSLRKKDRLALVERIKLK